MLAGAAIVFFAYIGFDSISTHAEEARNPSRDVPIGILTSLVLCTVLYIAVAAVLTGMVPYNQINIDAPVSDAFRQVGLPWAQLLISVGAIAGITSVLLVMMLSQPRIFLAMARDGLLPTGFFAAVHERFRTPWKSTILTGFSLPPWARFLPLRILAELVNIGTLLAFVIVCAAVLIMRRTHPEVHRPFRAPLGSIVPVLGILCCLMLMFSLPAENWLRLVVWLVIGLVIYFAYGRHHSRVGKLERDKEGRRVTVGVRPRYDGNHRASLRGPAGAARMKLLTAAQMREADRLTTERYGIPSLQLMENAGAAIAEFLREKFAGLARRKIVVLCGKGNNGGDGLVVARLLKESGCSPEVILFSNPGAVEGDAASKPETLATRAGRAARGDQRCGVGIGAGSRSMTRI